MTYNKMNIINTWKTRGLLFIFQYYVAYITNDNFISLLNCPNQIKANKAKNFIVGEN